MKKANSYTAYIEVQDTDIYVEEPDDDSVLASLFAALLFPLILVGAFFFVFRIIWKKQQKQVENSLELSKANTDAIALNNELLRESIALQKETLLEARKRNE